MLTNVNAKTDTLEKGVKLSPIIVKTVPVKTMEHVLTQQAIFLARARLGIKETGVNFK